MMIIP